MISFCFSVVLLLLERGRKKVVPFEAAAPQLKECPEKILSVNPPAGCLPLAIIVGARNMYCVNTLAITGRLRMLLRQLTFLGLQPVLVRLAS